MRARWLIWLLLSAPGTVAGQSLRLVHTVVLAEPPVLVSTDRKSTLYVANDDGGIDQYDSTGMRRLHYSPEKVGVPTLLEAWNTLRIFTFYQEFQDFLLLDRFLQDSPREVFAPEAVGYARLATLAADNTLWVYDDTDLSLKKYDPQRRQNLLVTPLGLQLAQQDFNFTFLREYQNQVFLSDPDAGLLVFDNLGSYRQTLDIPALDFFGFVGEEVYYRRDTDLIFQNLYTGFARTVALPALGEPIRQVLATDRRLFVFTYQRLFVYVYGF